MTNLKGSEKQIAWAEEIRNGWTAKLETLKEIEKREDTIEEEKSIDPLSGTEHTFTKSHFPLSTEENIALEESARYFTDKKIITVSGTNKKGIQDLIGTIETAIESEEDATFWINRRTK